MLLITDSITCCGDLKSYCCCDISRVNFVDLATAVSMHLYDTTNTLFLLLCSIQYIRTGVQCTGIYTEECKLTNEWVSHDLECKCCKWFIIRRLTNNFVTLFICTSDIRDIRWCRHILNNTIEQLLNTLILVCRTAIYRNCLTSDRALTKCFFHFIDRWLFTLKIFL